MVTLGTHRQPLLLQVVLPMLMQPWDGLLITSKHHHRAHLGHSQCSSSSSNKQLLQHRKPMKSFCPTTMMSSWEEEARTISMLETKN